MDVLQKGWGWLLGLGILLALLGVVLIAAPVLGTLAVDLLVAWFLIIGGIAQIVHAFMEKAWRGFLLELASGVLFLVVGGLLLFRPLAGAQALTLFLAAFLLVEGIVRTVRLRGIHPITQRTRFLNGSSIPHLGAWGAATMPLEHWFGSGILNV